MSVTESTAATKTTEQCPIRLSEGAIKELKRLMQEQQVPEGHGLRVGVKGGGCAGLSYILGFDVLQDNDRAFEIEDIPVYINEAHAIYLTGTEVDYEDGLSARGFVFNNPNASENCGCGSSFSA